MAKQKSAMICAYCGSEMNHHADKLIDPVKPEDLLQRNRRNTLLSRMRRRGIA